MAFALIYVTYPDEETAKKITDQLLEKKLVAGVNIYSIQSSYWWRGAVQREGEFVSIMQSPLNLWEELKTAITILHPYEVPCIIKMQAEANEDYEKWVAHPESE